MGKRMRKRQILEKRKKERKKEWNGNGVEVRAEVASRDGVTKWRHEMASRGTFRGTKVTCWASMLD
jgi:hypothetical protein